MTIKVLGKILYKSVALSLESCLKMNPDDWDQTPATTNLGKAQYHWTNINTALKNITSQSGTIMSNCPSHFMHVMFVPVIQWR